VRQYRHGAGEILLELPAGTFNPDEERPQAAAIRELKEETGYILTQLLSWEYYTIIRLKTQTKLIYL
jgi:8-oxo-dGTP pyrophosphatase MutT (NUDIX family)